MSDDNRIGLRFPRSAQRVLRNLSEQLRGRPDVDVSLFDKAADSVRDGVPLEVRFSDRSEVEQMVASFRSLGVAEPTIVDLEQRY